MKFVRENQQNSPSLQQIYNASIKKKKKFTMHSLESGPNSDLNLPDGH